MTDELAQKTAPKAARKGRGKGKPFQAGAPSANPTGRPKGSKNRTTVVAEALIDGQAKKIIQTIVGMALNGDSSMLRWLGDRLVPPRRERLVQFPLPPIESGEDALRASQTILLGAANGVLSCAEATELGKLLMDHARLYELHALEGRINALERERGIGALGTSLQ